MQDFYIKPLKLVLSSTNTCRMKTAAAIEHLYSMYFCTNKIADFRPTSGEKVQCLPHALTYYVFNIFDVLKGVSY